MRAPRTWRHYHHPTFDFWITTLGLPTTSLPVSSQVLCHQASGWNWKGPAQEPYKQLRVHIISCWRDGWDEQHSAGGRDVEAKWEDAKLLAAKLLASSTSRDTVIRNIAADGEDYLPAASVGHNMGPPQQQRPAFLLYPSNIVIAQVKRHIKYNRQKRFFLKV